MIRINKVKIYQYKCITDEIEMRLEKDITILAGKNEVGKTSVLEAIAKSNYFNKEDPQFCYEPEFDYPKIRKKELERQSEVPLAISIQYEVSKKLTDIISQEMLLPPQGFMFERTTNYKGQYKIIKNDFVYQPELFWEMYAKKIDNGIHKFIKKLSQIYNLEGYSRIYQQNSDKCTEEEKRALKNIKKYFVNKLNWDNPLSEYVFRTYLMPSIPQFIYYDEYFMLPSRISLNHLAVGKNLNGGEKTAKALLLLSDIDLQKFLSDSSREDRKVEIELANAKLTEYLRKYWSTNPDLRVEMIIDDDKKESNTAISHKRRGFLGIFKKNEIHISQENNMWLEIRIHDVKNMLSIPLEKRSRGFCWFFSFLIWFLAVENEDIKNICFLLDEPGQNLHAVAQEDLMRLLADLSVQSQFMITTHSAFMASQENVTKIRYMDNHAGMISIREYPIEEKNMTVNQKKERIPIVME